MPKGALMRRPGRILALSLAVGAIVVFSPSSAAGAGLKAMWGPTSFPTAAPDTAASLYQELGVDVFEVQLDWSDIALSEPADATNPLDPAYHWPTGPGSVKAAIDMAASAGMGVAVLVKGTPAWATGPGPGAHTRAPDDVGDFAGFLTAASVKYPAVDRWMIWGETNRTAVWSSGPAAYARLLDAGYAAIKAVDSGDTVVGGMTFTYGETSPAAWIAGMQLPGGLRPRLDEYGHNPFTRRCPDLGWGPNYLGDGARDISDIDTLKSEVDATFGPGKKLWLSEFTVSSDRANRALDFFVSREQQADWLTKAFAMAGSLDYVSGIGWFNLHDEPAAVPNGLTTGLMTFEGTRKPAFAAYAAAKLDGSMPIVRCPGAVTPPVPSPPPPPPAPPALPSPHFDLGVKLPRTGIAAMLRKGYRLGVSCPVHCAVTASLAIDRKTARKLELGRKAVTIGKAKASLHAGQAATVTVKVARRPARKLRRLRRLVLTLKISAQTTGGDSDSLRRRIVLRR
jgi:hypothetical protein